VDAVLKKGTKRGQFPRDGTLLESLVMQKADEFADGGVRDVAESRRLQTGRREKQYELLKVLAIV
jgi:hypothetical protein